MRSAYQVFSKNAAAGLDAIYDETIVNLRAVYAEAFGTDTGEVEIKKPPALRTAPPVLLGQTIALDLKGNWWSRWWQRRRGFNAYAVEFAEMIRAETDPMITGLKDGHTEATKQDAMRALQEFLDDQKQILINLLSQSGQETLHADANNALSDTRERLDEAIATLGKFAA